MLYNLIASTCAGSTILEWIDMAALAIEILAVVIIVVAMFYATLRFVIRPSPTRGKGIDTSSSRLAWAKPCCWAWRFWSQPASCER